MALFSLGCRAARVCTQGARLCSAACVELGFLPPQSPPPDLLGLSAGPGASAGAPPLVAGGVQGRSWVTKPVKPAGVSD